MLRIARTRAATSWLLGALLVVVYFSKDCEDPTVTKEIRQTKARTKNNSSVYSGPRCQKKDIAAANTVLLTAQFQDFLQYGHCRHFPMLLDMPDKCGGAEDVFLLLVIKSSPENYNRREVLRKTWAQERSHNGVWIRRIFIAGTSGNAVIKESLNKVLELEQLENNDILQWDFKDSFYNLTLKQILFLEWMERNCPHARFLLNGDDDVFANTDNMIDYLQSLGGHNGSQHLFTGDLIEDATPIRFRRSKYYVPYQVYRSKFYPPYCGGAGILLSYHTAMVIYNMSKSISILPIDDVYMGMCLAKAGLSPTYHVGVKSRGLPEGIPDTLDPCIFKNTLVVHRLISWKPYFIWQSINDPDLKCDTIKEN